MLVTQHYQFRRLAKLKRRSSPGFDLSNLRHSGIRGAADEAAFNKYLNFQTISTFIYSVHITAHIWQEIKGLCHEVNAFFMSII